MMTKAEMVVGLYSDPGQRFLQYKIAFDSPDKSVHLKVNFLFIELKHM